MNRISKQAWVVVAILLTYIAITSAQQVPQMPRSSTDAVNEAQRPSTPAMTRPEQTKNAHANLLANLERIRQSFGIGELEDDVASSTGVSWLPAYHDMGLIGGILTAMYMVTMMAARAV